jgi:dolichyl-phosphate beta-glucosyltransferase
MDFSIIIPALNEGHKIAADVLAAAEFLSEHFHSGEIIVVDDGSTDNTAEQAEVPVPDTVHLDVIRYEENKGKGYAVRRGILESSGDVVMFADSGLCVPYENALRGYHLLRNEKCDLAHGSRKRKDSVIVNPHLRSRRLVSWLYLLILRIWLKLPRHITDTQCGFKMYDGHAGRALYAKCTSNGFTFDIETILRAQQMGYKICEFPIEWTADTDTRLKLSRMPMHILKSFNQLRKELKND